MSAGVHNYLTKVPERIHQKRGLHNVDHDIHCKFRNITEVCPHELARGYQCKHLLRTIEQIAETKRQ
jgi:hypothetical protein